MYKFTQLSNNFKSQINFFNYMSLQTGAISAVENEKKKIDHFYQTIPGWVEGIDLVYKAIIDSCLHINEPLHFVEVGSWKGKSASFMTVEIINSGKNIRFDCVDTWLGSPENANDQDVINNTLFSSFLNNMSPVSNYYNAVRLSSLEASKLYDDKSLDFVFIDANHSYEEVKKDILAWKEKIKPGGILAGHDFSAVEAAVVECFGLESILFPFCWIKCF